MLIIGHRGCAYEPENTLRSFEKAMGLGIDMLEFDVHTTKDNQLVIIHDPKLNRTTNGHGDVIQYSYTYLQTLDAGSWFHPDYAGERIPTLKSVINILNDSLLSANVEIKSLPGKEESLVMRTLEVLKPHLNNPRFSILFSSFSIDALILLRKYSPHCSIGLLIHDWDRSWKKICDELNCISMHVNQEILTHKRVQEIKQHNKILLSYTVNDPLRAKKLYHWGVDAVFSDAPDKIMEVV